MSDIVNVYKLENYQRVKALGEKEIAESDSARPNESGGFWAAECADNGQADESDRQRLQTATRGWL